MSEPTLNAPVFQYGEGVQEDITDVVWNLACIVQRLDALLVVLQGIDEIETAGDGRR